MKKNKLCVCLIILILVSLFSIAASFKQCSKDTGTGYSEANNSTFNSMAGSDLDNTTSDALCALGKPV